MLVRAQIALIMMYMDGIDHDGIGTMIHMMRIIYHL